MYCNICVESCPVPARAPGDEEETKCIRMTREFEGATDAFPTLTFRFVRPGDAVVPFKPKKGVVEATPARGEIARQVRTRAQEYNRLAVKWAALRPRPDDSEEAVNAPAAVAARVVELHPRVAAAGDDPRKLEDLFYAEALAQTDCESCGYPSCRGYARGLLQGDPDPGKCEPGGARARRDVELIFQIGRGRWNKDGTQADDAPAGDVAEAVPAPPSVGPTPPSADS
jgi:ferredoxin